MIEALFMAPFLAAFLAGMPYAYRMYATWYEIQSDTREKALTSASKGCGGSRGGGADTVDTGGSLEETRRVVDERGDPGAQAALETGMNNVSSSKSANVSYSIFSTTVKAKSFGTCNETPHETSVQGWTEFGFEKNQGDR